VSAAGGAVKILAISGSLRAKSSNGALLRALPMLTPPGCEFTFRDPLDALPFFNPDLGITRPSSSAAPNMRMASPGS
jgi:NAD(P)H-dependent FMN reductase